MKTSMRKQQANRLNGRKGGVRTARGKAISRYNSRKHGLLSSEVVIQAEGLGESKEEFEALLEGFRSSFNPQDAVEEYLVEKLAVSAWKMRRLIRYEEALVQEAQEELDPNIDAVVADFESKIEEENQKIKTHESYIRLVTQTIEENVGSWSESFDGAWKLVRAVAHENLDEDGRQELSAARTIEEARQVIKQRLHWEDAKFSRVLIETLRTLVQSHEERLFALESDKADYIHDFQRECDSVAIPRPDEIDRIVRYGANIDRRFSKDLELLMKLQFVRHQTERGLLTTGEAAKVAQG